MKPEQAQAKWCPFARTVIASIEGPAFNRVVEITATDNVKLGVDQSLCLADKCMAWRWNISPEFANEFNRQITGSAHHKEVDGYCGAAGPSNPPIKK